MVVDSGWDEEAVLKSLQAVQAGLSRFCAHELAQHPLLEQSPKTEFMPAFPPPACAISAAAVRQRDSPPSMATVVTAGAKQREASHPHTCPDGDGSSAAPAACPTLQSTPQWLPLPLPETLDPSTLPPSPPIAHNSPPWPRVRLLLSTPPLPPPQPPPQPLDQLAEGLYRALEERLQERQPVEAVLNPDVPTLQPQPPLLSLPRDKVWVCRTPGCTLKNAHLGMCENMFVESTRKRRQSAHLLSELLPHCEDEAEQDDVAGVRPCVQMADVTLLALRHALKEILYALVSAARGVEQRSAQE